MTDPKNLEPLPKAPADQRLEPGGDQEAFDPKQDPMPKVPYSEDRNGYEPKEQKKPASPVGR